MIKRVMIANCCGMTGQVFKTVTLVTGLVACSAYVTGAQEGSLPEGTIQLDVTKIPVLKRPYWKKVEKSQEDQRWEAEVLEQSREEFGDDKKMASLAEVDRGMNALSSLDIASASEHFNRAWILDKSNPFSYVGVASIDRLIHDFDGFDEAVVLALQTGSNDPRVLTFLAFEYAREGRNDEALNYLQMALRVNPNFAPAEEIKALVEKRPRAPDSELIDSLEAPEEVKQ